MTLEMTIKTAAKWRVKPSGPTKWPSKLGIGITIKVTIKRSPG